ncbi:MAG: RNA-processing protein [Methanomicrobiales archaeon]|nr:RNA-processing protein [Methanomicrobiales archaeon]
MKYSMQRYWFGDVTEGGCTRAEGDAAALARRVSALSTAMEGFVPLRWEQAVLCGAVPDRAGYLALLRQVTMLLAERKIRAWYGRGDALLIQKVRMLEDLDRAANLVAERFQEWERVLHPGIRGEVRELAPRRALELARGRAEGAQVPVIASVDGLGEARAALVQEVSEGAGGILPNCTALVGGLVAARLLAAAGSLDALARLPAASLQVLGARAALFAHLRTGSPPPKHGILYQHSRVHNAPRNRRGKVARTLAARLAIAARLDRYRGTRDEAFLAQADEAVRRAGRGP